MRRNMTLVVAADRDPVSVVPEVRAAVHDNYGQALVHSAVVGATHHDRMAAVPDVLPGPRPTFFFAPTQLQKRMREWGPGGLQQRYGTAWRQFLEFTEPRICVVHGRGRAAVERVYLETLEGRSRPDEGHVLSVWE